MKICFCKFRLKPYALKFGGFGGSGTKYEWFGVSIWRFHAHKIPRAKHYIFPLDKYFE